MQWLFRRFFDRLTARLVVLVSARLDGQMDIELSECRAEMLRAADEYERDSFTGEQGRCSTTAGACRATGRGTYGARGDDRRARGLLADRGSPNRNTDRGGGRPAKPDGRTSPLACAQEARPPAQERAGVGQSRNQQSDIIFRSARKRNIRRNPANGKLGMPATGCGRCRGTRRPTRSPGVSRWERFANRLRISPSARMPRRDRTGPACVVRVSVNNPT